jgi:peptidoglycan/LPS O-acetylase OafA/YrhL
MKQSPFGVSRHRLDIQGLRAIAVALVVLYHSRVAFTGGFLGVDVFFVISGFVISEMIAKEISEFGTFSPSKFLARRLKRLFPALGAMISTVVIFSIFFESWILEQSRTQVSALAAIFSISNWKFATDTVGYFDIGNESNPLLHTWSLGVEEQFYLLVPLAVTIGLALYGKWRFRKHYIMIVIGVVAAISLAIQVRFSLNISFDTSQLSSTRRLTHQIGDPFYGTPARMWEFLVGVGACLFTRSSLHKSIRIRSALQRIGVIVILLVASSTNEGIPKWSTPNIVVVFVTAFILIVGTCESQTPTRFNILEWKPLVWIGDRSYGWYLWHWPFIVFSSRLFPTSQTTTFIASIVALIPAAISFRWIESPLRNWAPPRSVTIVKRISLITFPVFLIVVISHTWITPLIESNSGGNYSYSVEGCETSNKPCVINIDEATETILLEGDSHALSLSNTVLQIAKEKQSNLVVCIRQCIDSNPIEVLVKDYSITSIISMRQYQAIPGKTFDELINFAKSNSELNTVLLADNPRIKGFWQPPTLLGKKARTVSLQFVLEQQQDSIKLLTEIDKSVPNITVIPTLDFICFDQLCPIKLSGKFIYSDDNHLSVTGAALLYQPILEALNKK